MTHAVSMRATSMLASATVLGLLVFAAFALKFTIAARPEGPEAPPLVIFTPPEAPPISAPHPPTRPPPDTTGPTIFDPLPALAPLQTTAFAGPESGAVPNALAATITNPHWVRQPRNLASYYPTRAALRQIEGVVVLDCAVGTDGALTCAMVSETPPNWGFAQAALRISRDYAMVPASRDGHPVAGRYRMRLPFNLD